MDSTEKNELQPTPKDANPDTENSSLEKNEKPGGRRLRIKDTRKIDYNRVSPESRPYIPTHGQTRGSSSFRDESSNEGNDRGDAPSYHRQRSNDGYSDNYERRSYSQDGSYQNERRSYGQRYNESNERGYSRGRNYNQGGYRQDGFRPRRPGSERGMPPHRQNNYRKRRPPHRNDEVVQRPVKYKEVLVDPTAPIRLNKYIANSGVCSRREADEFIQAGMIKVNGETVTELGTKITRADKVTYQDQPIQIESKVYVLLNKPKNCVTTSDDPQNRQTVMDLVKNACHERIYPVGRLDRNTTGVLLLTNDGEMAAKLTHPSFKKKKIYHVWLDKDVSVEDMEKLANGIELEDGTIHADAISYVNEEDKRQVGIEIHSGKNRIVRRMFEMLNYHVTKLDRVYFAGLTKKNIGRGRWRYLSEQEVSALNMGAYE